MGCPRYLPALAVAATTLSLTLSSAHASSPEPTAAPPMDPPAPVVVHDSGDSLAITGDALWTGLEGDAVILVLRDGSEARGTVVAQSTDELAFAREADGSVVAVRKRDIASVRVIPPPLEPPPTKKTGRGLLGGGAFLLAFGGASTLSGTAILAVFPEFTFIHLPLLLPGLAMLGSGAAMVAVASKRRRDHDRRWSTRVERPRLMPIASVGKRSGHVGFALSF
jgi:hypothetical protein